MAKMLACRRPPLCGRHSSLLGTCPRPSLLQWASCCTSLFIAPSSPSLSFAFGHPSSLHPSLISLYRAPSCKAIAVRCHGERLIQHLLVPEDQLSLPLDYQRETQRGRCFVAHGVSAKKHKPRLDELCQERFPQHSRTLIQSWILQGKVLVDGQPLVKAGVRLSPKTDVEIIAEVPKYVCRAGYKLEAAIEHFACDVTEKVALDSGLSTGGFTDCLLQYGAACVYGVDVGYGQVAEKIRTDRRVQIFERTNLRHLSTLPQLVDIATLDLSFISILTVMPAVCGLMKDNSTLITLIKPQFEAQRSQVGSGGIVRDPAVHKEVIERVVTGVESHGFSCEGWMESPMKGADGNMEFLACFKRSLPIFSSRSEVEAHSCSL